MARDRVLAEAQLFGDLARRPAPPRELDDRLSSQTERREAKSRVGGDLRRHQHQAAPTCRLEEHREPARSTRVGVERCDPRECAYLRPDIADPTGACLD